MPSNHLILCHPLLLLPSIFPSIRVFSNESALCIRWPKYWSFSFSISPSNEHSGLISFRIDWLDLLAVQGTLKSLLQHHSSKASIIRRSAFFIVQLSHPYMTTGKIKALTRQTFVGKVMSLLFNMLSRLVITFLPRSKCLLISWLQSPSAVILEPPKIKSVTVSTVSPSICHEVMGPDAMILVFWILSLKTYPQVSQSLWQKFWLAVAWCKVRGTECSSECIGPFEGSAHYLHYLHHSLALGQMTGREPSPTLQQKIGLKVYWARPSFLLSQSLPSGSFQRSLILLHQRADWLKTTLFSNSMKPWARPCRATQDGWVIVESSDKTWSTGERNGKPLQYSYLENPMNSMKRQKD